MLTLLIVLASLPVLGMADLSLDLPVHGWVVDAIRCINIALGSVATASAARDMWGLWRAQDRYSKLGITVRWWALLPTFLLCFGSTLGAINGLGDDLNLRNVIYPVAYIIVIKVSHSYFGRPWDLGLLSNPPRPGEHR